MTDQLDTPNKIRVLIADDHGLVRTGLRLMLQTEPDMLVVGEAEDGQQALNEARRLRPDVMLLDISMPPPNGLEVVRQLSAEHAEVRVLMLTMHEDPHLVRESLKAGAAGYMVKRSVAGELISAIRTVARGASYVHGAVAPMGNGPRSAATASAAQPAEPGRHAAIELGEADKTMLRLLASGSSLQQVAQALGISVEQADSKRRDLAGRLGLRTRVDIMRYVQERGLSSQTGPL